METFFKNTKKERKITSYNSKFSGSNFDYDSYLEAINKCRDYIENGHSYQINLAQKLHFETSKDPWETYQDLLSINPVSFGAYLSFEDFHIICGSPELLVRKRSDKLFARPIAGTRKLGKNKEENLKFRKELEEDSKETSEHAMLVDLMRNDLGKVSLPGTVDIESYAKIIDYSHVMHLESEVRGRVDPNTNPLDILAAVFPGGTVTGVPKIRTMEIIHELEKK